MTFAEKVENARQADLLAIASRETVLKKAGSREWSGACPKCGGEDRFSVRMLDKWVWVCRGCSDGSYHDAISYQTHMHNQSFREAVEYLNDNEFTSEIKVEPPKPHPYWFGKSVQWYESKFEYNEKLWQSYRNLPPSLIEYYNLRVGVLPYSQCKHRRLIIPVFNQGLVNLRGRQFECDCKDDHGNLLKWLASGGWILKDLPLFNQNAIRYGSTVVIVESPIETVQIRFKQHQIAELLSRQIKVNPSDIVGVATYSTSYWLQNWNDWLRKAQNIIVAFDNDLAGNGGGEQGLKINQQRFLDWLPQIKSKGIERYNYLKDLGFPVMLLNWHDKPYQMDIGKYLETH